MSARGVKLLVAIFDLEFPDPGAPFDNDAFPLRRLGVKYNPLEHWWMFYWMLRYRVDGQEPVEHLWIKDLAGAMDL